MKVVVGVTGASGVTVAKRLVEELKKKKIDTKAIVSDIPCVDKIDITQINTGDLIEIEDGKITITKK